jgi:hypothetical protein
VRRGKPEPFFRATHTHVGTRPPATVGNQQQRRDPALFLVTKEVGPSEKRALPPACEISGESAHAFSPLAVTSVRWKSELDDCDPVVLVFEVRRRGALSGGLEVLAEAAPYNNPWSDRCLRVVDEFP